MYFELSGEKVFSVWNRGFDILNGFQNGTNAPLIKVANIMNFL